MSEMIERVARAICEANGRDPDELCADYMMEKDRVAAGNPAREWEIWEDDARAAIAAMNPPTEAMVHQGWSRSGSSKERVRTIYAVMVEEGLARNGWRSTNDEALK